MQVLINWLVSALIVLVLAFVLPGVSVTGFVGALIVALVLGIINALLRPLAMFMSMPLNILTFGLFTLVVDTVMVLIADWALPMFEVASFWWALIFAVALGILNLILKGEERG